MPTLTAALVTDAAPVAPDAVTGPVAVSVKAVAAAEPPLLLTTDLLNVSFGAMSVLLMVQVMF